MSEKDELIRALEHTRDEALGYFSLGDADLARAYAPGKWTVRHLLNHLTDSEIVLTERGKRTVKEEFDKVASHTTHHLSQIRQALAGRAAG